MDVVTSGRGCWIWRKAFLSTWTLLKDQRSEKWVGTPYRKPSIRSALNKRIGISLKPYQDETSLFRLRCRCGCKLQVHGLKNRARKWTREFLRPSFSVRSKFGSCFTKKGESPQRYFFIGEGEVRIESTFDPCVVCKVEWSMLSGHWHEHRILNSLSEQVPTQR